MSRGKICQFFFFNNIALNKVRHWPLHLVAHLKGMSVEIQLSRVDRVYRPGVGVPPPKRTSLFPDGRKISNALRHLGGPVGRDRRHFEGDDVTQWHLASLGR